MLLPKAKSLFILYIYHSKVFLTLTVAPGKSVTGTGQAFRYLQNAGDKGTSPSGPSHLHSHRVNPPPPPHPLLVFTGCQRFSFLVPDSSRQSSNSKAQSLKSNISRMDLWSQGTPCTIHTPLGFPSNLNHTKLVQSQSLNLHFLLVLFKQNLHLL